MGKALTFDTLDYANKLRKAGFTQKQAEVQVQALAEIIEDRIATKEDIGLLKQDIGLLKQDIGLVRKDVELVQKDIKLVQKDIKQLENTMTERDAKLDLRFKELEMRLTIRMGGMIAAAAGIVATLVKIL